MENQPVTEQNPGALTPFGKTLSHQPPTLIPKTLAPGLYPDQNPAPISNEKSCEKLYDPRLAAGSDEPRVERLIGRDPRGGIRNDDHVNDAGAYMTPPNIDRRKLNLRAQIQTSIEVIKANQREIELSEAMIKAIDAENLARSQPPPAPMLAFHELDVALDVLRETVSTRVPKNGHQAAAFVYINALGDAVRRALHE